MTISNYNVNTWRRFKKRRKVEKGTMRLEEAQSPVIILFIPHEKWKFTRRAITLR